MYPRAKALGVVLNGNCILLEEFEGKHSKGTGPYYRPIGGTIEMGEMSDSALIREYKEELNIEITIVRYITCLENIFEIDEAIGHEIIQIYIVDINDESVYEEEHLSVMEGNDITLAKWIPIEEIITGKKIIYPNGLTEILSKEI